MSNFVSVLLKTSDDGDTAEALSRFVHQALVRRSVVIELIEGAVSRGHRAYKHVDLRKMRERAEQLPEHGVPPEIAKLLPYDNDIDKLQVQKAATPVDPMASMEATARTLANSKPNGVVLERSSYDDADINAQRIAALRHFSTKLGLSHDEICVARETENRAASGMCVETTRPQDSKKRIHPTRTAESAVTKLSSDVSGLESDSEDVDGSTGALSDPASFSSASEAEADSTQRKRTRKEGGSVADTARLVADSGGTGQTREATVVADMTRGSSTEATSENSKRVKAISEHAAQQIQREQEAGATVERLCATTGNKLVDQFEPWYFGVAFAFVFKYCLGMPDMPVFTRRNRWRRTADAPRVEPASWMRIFARRIEGQVSRDWTFGFASWNFVFRSAVNLSRTLLAYDSTSAEKTEGKLTPQMLQEGAVEICKGLRGKYIDVDGKKKNVAGDMTKIRYIAGLSPAARRLLVNLEHTSRKLPGTQETRRQMRFDTNALRVRYGVPIFVTFSPDEAHSLLMVRLSRLRTQDPVLLNENRETPEGAELLHTRSQPPVQGTDPTLELGIPIRDLLGNVPTYDQRRRTLARDSLASVDGFRALVALAHEHLFGVRTCPFCPDCNNGENSQPCQDLFGSSAKPEGGIFGRVDAIYTSIEAQKSTGSLHAHSQVFVECLHQHTPLSEVMCLAQPRARETIDGYLRYKEHVCRQVYADTGADMEKSLTKIEGAWPRYEEATLLLKTPEYQKRNNGKTAT